MDNVFITQYFDWNPPRSRRVLWANQLLRKVGRQVRLVPEYATGSQTNVEQRMNLFHLLSQLLVFAVPGDVVELGSHEGSSAAVMAKVIQSHDPSRRLHLFDAFLDSPAERLLERFRSLGLPLPEVHPGWFQETLPGQLPERICFAHIDCGPSKSPDYLEQTIRLSLEALYPRLSPRGVCLLADYCDPDVYGQDGFSFPQSILYTRHWNQYPQVKRACDAFLKDKPEKVAVLYSGDYSHGYLRKHP